MLIFIDAKLALLANPKTGTTAFQAALSSKADMVFKGKPSIKHMTAKHFDRFIAPYLLRAHKLRPERIAVVRDPLELLGSWYRYRQRSAVAKAKSTSGISFSDFIEGYLNPNPPAFVQGVGTQIGFVSSQKGEIRINHLFAYERIDLVIEFLSKRLGADLNPSKINTSPQKDISLDPALEARLRAHCAVDFALHKRILDAGGHLVTPLE